MKHDSSYQNNRGSSQIEDDVFTYGITLLYLPMVCSLLIDKLSVVVNDGVT